MHTTRRRVLLGGGASLAALGAGGASAPAGAATAEEIQLGVRSALLQLYSLQPEMRRLAGQAYGALVIPEIIRGGFVVGGAYGEGALVKAGAIDSYWSYAASSIGFSAGATRYRQALFFMNERIFQRFDAERGSFGVLAEAVVVDDGARVSVETLAQIERVIVASFGARGLIGGASLLAGRYTRIDR